MSCPIRRALHPDKYPGFFGSTGWGDAICVVPWMLWLHYGDRDVLEETLPAMVKWVDFVWSISNGPIVRPPRAWGARGFTFGDWLQPQGPSEKPLPDDRRRRRGDDLPLHLVGADGEGRRGPRRHGARQAHDRARRRR